MNDLPDTVTWNSTWDCFCEWCEMACCTEYTDRPWPIIERVPDGWFRGARGKCCVLLCSKKCADNWAQFVANIDRANATLDRLRADHPDDWDGEGAPSPSEEAIARAGKWIDVMERHWQWIDDLCADVTGGVGVFVSRDDRVLWLSFANSGEDTAVVSDKERVVWHTMLRDTTESDILSALYGSLPTEQQR